MSSRQNTRPTSRGKGTGQNPWMSRTAKEHVPNKRGNMNIGRNQHNRNQRPRGPNGGGRRKNRMNINQGQQQPKLPSTAGTLSTLVQPRVQFANCGVPTYGINNLNNQHWQFQPHNLQRTDLVAGTNPALTPGHFYTTQQPPPNQQQNAKTDIRNRGIETPQNVPPNTQAMQGQLYASRQQLGNPGLNMGFEMQQPIGIPMGQNPMGPTILRQSPSGLGRGGVPPQIKSPEQPGQPTQPNPQSGEQMGQQAGKDNVNKSNTSGNKPPEVENPAVAFGQHSMNNIRPSVGLVAPAMNRAISAPPFFQYAIPSNWQQSPMPSQQGMIQSQMIPQSFINQVPSQHCFPLGYMVPQNMPHYMTNPQPSIVAVPNPVPIPKLRTPDMHNRLPKNPPMPSNDQTAASREMREKFQQAAGGKTTAIPVRQLPPSQPIKPSPAPQVPTIEPPDEMKANFARSPNPPNKRLNPNAPDFTPTTSIIGSPGSFVMPASPVLNTFTPSKTSQPAPMPKPPQSDIVQSSVLSKDNVGEQTQKPDVLAQAWMRKRSPTGDLMQDDTAMGSVKDEIPNTSEPAPALDSILISPRKPHPSAIHVDEEEDVGKDNSSETHTNEDESGTAPQVRKRWILCPQPAYSPEIESAEVENVGSDHDNDSSMTYTLKRLTLTGKQLDLDYDIKYPMKDFLKFQQQFSDLPCEIDDVKEKRAHFRQFQGPSSRVDVLMKMLSKQNQNSYSSPRQASTRQRNPRPAVNMRPSHQLNQRQEEDGVMLDRNQMGSKKAQRRRSQPHRPSAKPLPPSSVDAYIPNVGTRQREIEKDEKVKRTVNSLLNKITPDKFESVSGKLVIFCKENCGGFEQLKRIAQLVFVKACQEPLYSHLYANLCNNLSKSLQVPQAEDEENEQAEESEQAVKKTGTKNPFRRALLSECQTMFDKGTVLEEHAKKDKVVKLDEDEMRGKAKQKVIGNIKFIGELFKLKLIHERIVHRCIQNLLTNQPSQSSQTASNVEKETMPISKMDLEAAVNLLRTTGKDLDRITAKKWVNQYFNYLDHHAKKMKDKRIMFMVKNLEDLRNNKWESRKEKEKLMTKAAVKEQYHKGVETKNHQTRRRDRDRDRDPQNSRRTGTPQNRRQPAASRNRSTASTRRPMTQHINNSTGKGWTTPSTNSQDVRSLTKRNLAKLDQSQIVKKGGSRPVGRVASPKSHTYIPPQHVAKYARPQRELSPSQGAERFEQLWTYVQDAVENPCTNGEHTEAWNTREKAIKAIIRSSVKPENFILDILIRYFEQRVNINSEQRAELANFLLCLIKENYFTRSTFQDGINLYAARFEDYNSDSPNMVLYTVELIDRCFEDKEIVLEFIDDMLEIMKNPKDEYHSNLCSHLGRALLEFMDNPGPNRERERLIGELNKRDLKKFFTFRSNKNDPGTKPGNFNAKRFLKQNPVWLQKAGYA